MIDRKQQAAGALVALFSLAVFAADLLVPLLMHAGREAAALAAWKALSPLCHQDFDRSLFIAGWQMGLCARCTAMYFFSFLGGLLMVLAPGPCRSRRATYPPALLLMAPMLLESGLAVVLGIDSPLWIRMLTGSLYGLGAAVLIVRVASYLWNTAGGLWGRKSGKAVRSGLPAKGSRAPDAAPLSPAGPLSSSSKPGRT